MTKGGRLALGLGAGAVAVGALAYVGYRASTLGTSGTPGSSGTGGGPPGGGSAAIQLGQPTLTEAVSLHRVFQARRGPVRSAIRGVFVGATGINTFAAMSGQQGQALDEAVTVANGTGAPIYVQIIGVIWENTGASVAPLGTVDIDGTQYPIGGHLVDPSGVLQPKLAVAAGQSATVSLHSGGLDWTATSDGIYLTVNVYSDSGYSQALSGSPLVAWSNAFLTIQPPSAGSAISVTLGSPSVA